MEINLNNINYWNKQTESENMMKAVRNYKNKRNTAKVFGLMKNNTKNSKTEKEVALKKADNYKKKRNTERVFKLMKNNTKNSKTHKASVKDFQENWRRKQENKRAKNAQLKTRPPQILKLEEVNQKNNSNNISQAILRITIEIYRNPNDNDYIQSIIEFIRKNKNHIIKKFLEGGISIKSRKQFKDIISKYGIDLSVHDLFKISDKTIDELESSLLNREIKNKHILYGFRTSIDTIEKDKRGVINIYLKPTLILPIITRSKVEYDARKAEEDQEDIIFNNRMKGLKSNRVNKTQKKWNNKIKYNMNKLSMHEPTHFANLL